MTAQHGTDSAATTGNGELRRGRPMDGLGTFACRLPIMCWLPDYKKIDLPSDALAGAVVAVMLIPQAMAYAMLAGLPPVTGLYASVLPLIAYAVFGTSRTLGTGPVAIVSLMVASSLAPIAAPGSPEYVAYALLLAVMAGLVLMALGFLGAGALTNFMSHPVVAGFTAAAGLIIAASQLGHLLGLSLERTHLIPKIVAEVYAESSQINIPTLAIAAVSLTVLFNRNNIGLLTRKFGLLGETSSDMLAKAMPLIVVALATWVSYLGGFADKGVKVVGAIPSGLPGLTLPHLDVATIQLLAPGAVLIAAVGFLESISIARTLASRRRQKVEPDKELIGLGIANIAAGLTGGYPVAGSFTRSSVNFASGARTQLSAIITAVVIAATLLLFTSLLYHLPRATLAAIVVMAVSGLVDFSAVRRDWRYMKLDATSFIATFFAVLALGIEEGLLIGVALSIAFFLWRTSTPQFVVLGRLGNTELFRDERAHEVRTYPSVLFLRVDMSLYFANAAALEDFVLRHVADHKDVQHFVLVCSAVNMIDSSALETMESLRQRLRDSDVIMHLAAVKSSILRRMKQTEFLHTLAPGQIFLSANEAARILVPPELYPLEMQPKLAPAA